MTPLEIASVCHEANRRLTMIVGDVPVQPPWEDAGADMQASSVRGVEFCLANPDAPPSASHDAWMKDRLSNGWKRGPVKNTETKEHPALVPYDELLTSVKRKDALFKNVCAALGGAL